MRWGVAGVCLVLGFGGTPNCNPSARKGPSLGSGFRHITYIGVTRDVARLGSTICAIQSLQGGREPVKDGAWASSRAPCAAAGCGQIGKTEDYPYEHLTHRPPIYLGSETGTTLDVWFPRENQQIERNCLAKKAGIVRADFVEVTIADLADAPQ